MSMLPIVPTEESETGKDVKIRMVAPKTCYFKRNEDNNFHSKLFVFVNFGPKANSFLSACGTKHEPSVEEVAEMVLGDPLRFYHLAGGREKCVFKYKIEPALLMHVRLYKLPYRVKEYSCESQAYQRKYS